MRLLLNISDIWGGFRALQLLQGNVYFFIFYDDLIKILKQTPTIPPCVRGTIIWYGQELGTIISESRIHFWWASFKSQIPSPRFPFPIIQTIDHRWELAVWASMQRRSQIKDHVNNWCWATPTAVLQIGHYLAPTRPHHASTRSACRSTQRLSTDCKCNPWYSFSIHQYSWILRASCHNLFSWRFLLFFASRLSNNIKHGRDTPEKVFDQWTLF